MVLAKAAPVPAPSAGNFFLLIAARSARSVSPPGLL